MTSETRTSTAVDSRDPSAALIGDVLTVDRVVPETADATTIGFAIPDARSADYEFAPGQFVTVAVPSAQTGWVARCYSISSAPSQPGVALTVKRTTTGYASNWLCDNVSVGDRLRVLPPSGLFSPRSPEADLLLCAAGSGVTPEMSILRTVLESVTGRIAFFYANRDAESIIFGDELAELGERYGERLVVEHWLEAERGRPTAGDFARWAQAYRDREIFTCGPAPFMQMIRDGAAAAGFDTVRIQTEEYRSLTGDPFEPMAEFTEESLSDAGHVEVNIDDETYQLAWPATHTLVDVMVHSGIDTPYACREGKCGACTCRLAEGEVDLGRTDALEPDDIADGYILGCQAKPASKVIKIEF
ncbi:2Fe-2S iron-sulfur cluster-binding protein [Gordonia sp. (in: high G+C Gram-positive bacteria)]|uniref:2Fe-2S iron-sulfur cluster-binding protein n=1 Tax=Gordonia sp. (in: high G+C Gram-positive bacteria) TaxID=84139 RepID=UPI003F9597EF